jgi:hypothetical protein
MAVLFISEKYLKDNSYIDNNVDDKLITPLIILAQDKHILPVTGTSLWNDILSQIISGTVSSDYQDLLNNYLQKATLWWTLVEAVLPLSYKFTNKNVMQKNSDNGQPASMTDLLKLKDQFTNNAEYYSERAIRHLRANTDLFPLYLQITGNSLEMVRPQGNAYNAGMYLGIPPDQNRRIPFSELYQGKNGICPDDFDNNYYYYNE